MQLHETIIWLAVAALTTATGICVIFHRIIYSKRFKSANLEEKAFVMNEGCVLLQLCVSVRPVLH